MKAVQFKAVHVAGLIIVPMLCAAPIQAAEVKPSGQLQFQGDYLDTPLADGSHWQLAMPDGRFGVTVAEPLATSALIGRWQVAIDPLAEDDEVELRQHQAYLNWRKGIVSLWGGRLATVEQTFLVDLSSNLMSQSQKGLAVGSLITPSENKAIRVDLASGDAIVVTSQWVIDDSLPGTQWSGATVLRTPDGVLAVTVRNVPNKSPIWGNLIQWKMGNAVLSGVWLYQDELLAWDLSARSQTQSLQSFVAYRVLGDDEGRWSVGIHQATSESVTGFSEVYWLPANQGWQWSSGFQIKF